MNNQKQKLSAVQLEEGRKILLVIRHAKSSWELGSLTDFERPLNERGKKDAPIMAKRLIDRNIPIDVFVSSPAKRAKKTAELFCETYGKSEDSIVFVSMLYHATPESFYEVVENLDDTMNVVAVFSHNPGITEFVNSLAAGQSTDNVPTCGIFAVQIQLKKWAEFRKSKKEFLFFDYPKL